MPFDTSRVAENLEAWVTHFESTWLKRFKTNGTINWDDYQYIKNTKAPAGQPVDLSGSQILFITSAGAYLPESQQPFDAANPLGDYSIRTFSINTVFGNIDYAHDHYDQSAVRSDPQVLLPFNHLRLLVKNGFIAGLMDPVISFMGYQPDVRPLLDQTIPAILDIVRDVKPDAILLVPS